MTNSAFILVLSVTFALTNTAHSQTDCARSVHSSADMSCTGVDGNGKPLIVNIKTLADESVELSVELNSVLVFKRFVNIRDWTDRRIYTSTEFKNANAAPTRLMLQTYVSGKRLVGHFTEISYLPQISTAYELTCL